MAIVVIGAGAIGLLVAGRLAQAAQSPILLARPAVAAAITRQGLHIRADGAIQSVAGLSVIEDAAALTAPPDLAIVCVKGYDTAGVLPTLGALRPQAILTLQNGIGNEEILAERLGASHIISGAITTSVEVEAPGAIAVTKHGGIGLAPVGRQPPLDHWAGVLNAAGFVVRCYADYRALKWSKALLNMLGNATAAILDLPVEAVYADTRLVAIERAAFLEALQVMGRLDIRPLNLPRYPAAFLAVAMRLAAVAPLDPLLRRLIARGRGGKPPSLHIDLARGSRRSEAEFLYGAIARAAAAAGMRAPVNQALWETLRAIIAGEVAWDRYRRRPDELIAAVSSRKSF